MQFIDLKAQYRALKTDIDANIQTVLDSAQFIGGPQVKELETQLAAFVSRKHCVTCANGTDALQIAYMVAGVGEGDAVFCPDMTFISSTEPAKMFGAASVFCDITPDTYSLCPESLERQIQAVLAEGKLTPKAVVAVDILGNPCDYDAIVPICEKYGLFLIEDAAQSFGASYKGKRACAFGHIATTSFFPAKPLGCYGDGGAIFTDDDEMDALIRSLCVHGKGPGGKYDNIRVGMNSRLDTIQAAVLLPKLKALDDYEIDARQTVVGRYNTAFAGKLQTPFVADGCVSTWAQYAVLAKDTETRDRIIAHLKEKNIPNMVYYPTPQHGLPVFKDEPTYGEVFANANDYCARTFSLPMHPYLEESEQQTVIDAVLEAL
ncbi:DegT/DnrJ/EryC1/StrS family aminotransferase [Pseudoflavonifractor phocaeensis]|uniref:DegT/DnrJ/EryC1/StrS family aminotransferase n=1 Tax=Pseudoflavonifractor phocaeensis TaxID=1870988 RepID=UPI001F2B578D|nr:DegT/DnrJ/EryC1/StrS aminotransferase family protein [Pseudoflavonifractor phocaeensis]MCF2661520.1 DegT/DnrJ/EryC1/StrS aminotransferase family protein [Pseudoflavonifractor phocaeensis]